MARRALATVFDGCPDLEVVGEASTGREAMEKAQQLEPRLITMDLDMPDGNGLQAIEQIMAFTPTRIMVVTGVPRFDGQDASFEALSRGALELIPKPTAWPATDLERQNIIGLARRLSSVPVLHHTRASREKRRSARRVRPSLGGGADLVAIGASTGGPGALKAILEELPPGFSEPIVIVQHLTDVFAAGFIEWLGSCTNLVVREALPGTRLEPGSVYVAVRGSHIAISHRGWIEASHQPPRAGHCPSIDVLFESVASAHGPRAVGILLTGMGKDGAAGLRAIRDSGGVTVAQDEASCTVFGMPKAAIELEAATHVVPVREIASTLIRATALERESVVGE
ncbi:MAG: chemotaxis-specific protein-glutamate methyltransferase CheB [Actinomycetia bacterium]|nr:chemotaxis-specific protein-glutamate methyltransferase CheB [Actinomycetes bacterium]